VAFLGQLIKTKVSAKSEPENVRSLFLTEGGISGQIYKSKKDAWYNVMQPKNVNQIGAFTSAHEPKTVRARPVSHFRAK
jgi:hypothetical protein